MSKKYLVKIGMMLLDITDNDKILQAVKTALLREDLEAYYSKINELYRRLPDILDRSPYISNLEWSEVLSDKQRYIYYSIAKEGTYCLPPASSYMKFTCRLPKAKRKYWFNVKHLDVIEEFRVLYNGEFFIAYVENPTNENVELFGAEARELLKEALKSDLWRPQSIPPCPIRENFVIHNFQNIEDGYHKNRLVLRATGEAIENIDKTLVNLASIMNYTIETYYDASKVEAEKCNIEQEINELITDMSEQMERLLELENYDLIAKHLIMKEIVKKSCKFQLLSNKYNEKKLLIDDYVKRIINNPPLVDNNSSFVKALVGSLSDNTFSVEDKRETVKFIQSIVAGAYTNHATIFSGLIGALLGGIIGTYLGSILGK